MGLSFTAGHNATTFYHIIALGYGVQHILFSNLGRELRLCG